MKGQGNLNTKQRVVLDSHFPAQHAQLLPCDVQAAPCLPQVAQSSHSKPFDGDRPQTSAACKACERLRQQVRSARGHAQSSGADEGSCTHRVAAPAPPQSLGGAPSTALFSGVTRAQHTPWCRVSSSVPYLHCSHRVDLPQTGCTLGRSRPREGSEQTSTGQTQRTSSHCSRAIPQQGLQLFMRIRSEPQNWTFLEPSSL